MLSYTHKEIQLLLELLGIPAWTSSHLANDKCQRYHMYYLPHQSLTKQWLLKDILNYIARQGLDAKERRVCFLLDEPLLLALVIDFATLNKDNLQKIHAHLNTISPAMIDNFGDDTFLANWLKQLYHKVQCILFIGSKLPRKALDALIALLESVYQQPELRLQPIEDNNYFDTVFIECLRQFLYEGALTKIEVTLAYQQHYQYCLAAMAKQLDHYRQEQPNLAEQIKKHLSVLFKYSLLQQHRLRFDLKTASLEQLEQIQQLDAYNKLIVYCVENSSLNYLKQMSIRALLDLLMCHDVLTLENKLRDKRQTQLQLLKQWEIDLKQHEIERKQKWTSYLLWGSKLIIKSIYYNSLIGLCGELSQLASNIALDSFCKFNIAKQFNQRKGFTISKEYLLMLAKFMGGGLGLYYSIFNGSYQFIRLLLINLFNLKFNETFASDRIDDEEATIIFYQGYLPNRNNSLRAISLATAMAEAYYSDSITPIIDAVGGIIGSSSMFILTQRIITKNNSLTHLQPTEGQLLMICLLSIGGYEIGRQQANMIYDIYERTIVNEQVAQLICKESTTQENIIACITDSNRNQQWSPSFWFSKQDPIRLSWITKQSIFYDTECHIRKLPSNERIVICDAPAISKTLRIV